MSRIACLVALTLAGAAARGGVMLTAEVTDTPGMPGYQTYDISAWSPLGYIGGFDFLDGASGGGIVGSLAQATASPDGGVWYDPLYTDGSLTDSHWLFPQSAGLQIGASQSGSGLYGAFTLFNSEADGAPRSRPIARLVTNDPSSVTIGGDFDVREYWDDGTRVGSAKHRVDVRLSDLEVAPPRNDNSLPSVPESVLAERQRQAEREAAAEAYRERMANWQPDPEPPATPTPMPPPVEPEPVPPTTPAESPEVPATAVVTLQDYQNDLDSQAAAIQRQIEALKLSLNEVIDQRTASEEPGFQVPTYRGGTITLTDRYVRLSSDYVTIDAIQIEPIRLHEYELTDFVATTTAFDANAGYTGSSLMARAFDFGALPVTTTATISTPEPSGLSMLAAAAVSLSGRSRNRRL